jgi:hypothetical protein
MDTFLIATALVLILSAAITSFVFPKKTYVSTLLMSLFFVAAGIERYILSSESLVFVFIAAVGAAYFGYKAYRQKIKADEQA